MLIRIFTGPGRMRDFAWMEGERIGHLGINHVIAGGGILSDHTGKHALAPGTTFIRRPGAVHDTVTTPDFGECSVGLPSPCLPALVALGIVPPAGSVFPGLPDRSLVAAVEDLAARAAGRTLADSHLMAAAIATVVRLLDRSASPTLPPAVARLRDALEADLAGRRTVAEIATEAGIPPSVVARTFRACLAAAPDAWRRARRLQAAVPLLEHATVKEVAARLGYASASAFGDAFRRFHGRPPRRLRRAGQRR
jgi:AraC-like DNA-binding protein